MKKLISGDISPVFEISDQDGKVTKLSDYKGKKVLIYFYPRANTPGCTTEAKNFRDSIEKYLAKQITIIGISADSVASHKKFQVKYDLPFTLLADADKVLLKKLGAIEGGRTKRRTWLIDENWEIELVYEKVSAKNHDAQLCEFYSI